MAKHVAVKDPRAHWLLLLLSLLVLLVVLSLHGYTAGVGGGTEHPASGTGRPPAGDEFTHGGPVIRLDGAGPVSRAMPAGPSR